MRILLTGGAGFIGSHLARRLIGQGHSVGILDNRVDWGNVSDLRLRKRYPFDCRDLQRVCLECLGDGSWEFCYHLASTVGVNRVLADPQECIENIVESTRAVLKLGIPGMYFSTSEVYGKNTERAREDSDCVISPAARWSYAAAKLCGEWLSLAHGWKVVRLFNVIGPNQSRGYGAVVPRFLEHARQGLAIPVYGDGQQKRTFTSVFDVVQILDLLRDKSFDVVNVGSENTVTILELAKLAREACGSLSTIAFVPYRVAYGPGFEECPERVPDLRKLRSLIGEFKFQSIEQTLKETVNGQQQRYEGDVQALESAVSGL